MQKITQENIASQIKQRMMNEVPNDYEIYDEEYVEKSFSLDIDHKKILKVSAIAIVILIIFLAGMTLRTPISDIDKEIIKATDTLRGLEKVKVEYASGTNSRAYKIQVLEKEIVEIWAKNMANDGEIGKIKDKIEQIINTKSLSK